jgi:alpha/beta hydrolase family protein DUF900
MIFVNLRATPVGGIVADEARAWEDGRRLEPDVFASRVRGRNLLLATHGFNVDQHDGIQALSVWSERCALPSSWLFVGVLWAGDSRFAPIFDYVYEGVEAIRSGQLLARYLNDHAAGAQSLAFASHSLGARVVLETIRGLDTGPRRIVLMAPAIENDCLAREYHDAALKVSDMVYVLASRRDAVLEFAFPAGNLIGEIVMHGHPYDRTALGREGPARPLPADVKVTSWQIPDAWDYGHLDYLPKADIGAPIVPPEGGPGANDPAPIDPAGKPWKPAWSAGAVAEEVSARR